MTLSTFHKVNLDASWSTAPVAFYDPPPPDPGIDTEPELPPVYPEEGGYMLLDTVLTRQNQGRCVNCGGKHITYQCVEIGDLLLAP
jgi:hypothetical protein